MSTFVGTAYFRSKIEAIKYLAMEGSDKESVETYIKEGLIHIGTPPLVPRSDLMIQEGRYVIKEQ